MAIGSPPVQAGEAAAAARAETPGRDGCWWGALVLGRSPWVGSLRHGGRAAPRSGRPRGQCVGYAVDRSGGIPLSLVAAVRPGVGWSASAEVRAHGPWGAGAGRGWLPTVPMYEHRSFVAGPGRDGDRVASAWLCVGEGATGRRGVGDAPRLEAVAGSRSVRRRWRAGAGWGAGWGSSNLRPARTRRVRGEHSRSRAPPRTALLLPPGDRRCPCCLDGSGPYG